MGAHESYKRIHIGAIGSLTPSILAPKSAMRMLRNETHTQTIGVSVLDSTHRHLTKRHEGGSICFLVLHKAEAMLPT